MSISSSSGVSSGVRFKLRPPQLHKPEITLITPEVKKKEDLGFSDTTKEGLLPSENKNKGFLFPKGNASEAITYEIASPRTCNDPALKGNPNASAIRLQHKKMNNEYKDEVIIQKLPGFPTIEAALGIVRKQTEKKEANYEQLVQQAFITN